MTKRKGNTSRRDFIKAASAVMVVTTAVAAQGRPNVYVVTAERMAVLIEAPETPEPLRGMLLHVAEAYAWNMADELPPAVTADYVRRELPGLMAEAVRSGFIYSDLCTVATAFWRKPCGEEGSDRRPTVNDRARAIIADVQGYDEETRHAIQNSLDENAEDLAELVRRAEAGEIILDVSAPLVRRGAPKGGAS